MQILDVFRYAAAIIPSDIFELDMLAHNPKSPEFEQQNQMCNLLCYLQQHTKHH